MTRDIPLNESASWKCPNCGGNDFAEYAPNKYHCAYCGSALRVREVKPASVDCPHWGFTAAWLLDAQAAMATVKTLPGVDATRIAAIGASIGADGAVDACGEGCMGALSLSPGDYLTVPYTDAVAAMQETNPPKPAWCLAAEGDTPSALACRAATGEHYRAFIYPGNEHGLMLLQPSMDPETMGLILDFLRLVFGIT